MWIKQTACFITMGVLVASFTTMVPAGKTSLSASKKKNKVTKKKSSKKKKKPTKKGHVQAQLRLQAQQALEHKQALEAAAARKQKELLQARKQAVKRHKASNKKTKKTGKKKSTSPARKKIKKVAPHKQHAPAVQPAHNDREKLHHASFPIVDVRVPSQSGAECGYNALFYAWDQYNNLTGKPRPVLADNLPAWKKRVANHRRRKGDDQWITDAEIADLAQTFVAMPPQDYTILPDVEQLAQLPVLNDISGTLRQIRSGGKNIHAFILGNMQHNALKGQPVGGTAGHWIAVVVHAQDGHLKYYVLDSLNGKPRAVVRALKHLLEDIDVNDFELRAIITRETNIASLATLEHNDHTLALQSVSHLIDLAQQSHGLQRSPFTDYKEKIHQILRSIALQGTPTQKEQAVTLLKRMGITYSD